MHITRLVEKIGRASFKVFGKTNRKQMLEVAKALKAQGFTVFTGELGDRPVFKAGSENAAPSYRGRIGRMLVQGAQLPGRGADADESESTVENGAVGEIIRSKAIVVPRPPGFITPIDDPDDDSPED